MALFLLVFVHVFLLVNIGQQSEVEAYFEEQHKLPVSTIPASIAFEVSQTHLQLPQQQLQHQNSNSKLSKIPLSMDILSASNFNNHNPQEKQFQALLQGASNHIRHQQEFDEETTSRVQKYRQQKETLQPDKNTVASLCASLPQDVVGSLKLCKLVGQTPAADDAISKGKEVAIKECQRQFEKERWNCSHALGNQYLLTDHMSNSGKLKLRSESKNSCH